ncbi:RRQRL motif-containing zinc-binding protein [Frankia sp. R43]|uniref:RRQRL motif-containing zinc-binding protein n=1 Tax=Frankia sp. R43 TaxID=269536 RepID=UPI0026F4785E|nr:RRQRL motif-containing zinc-binding protein [Frankia sp. R43]
MRRTAPGHALSAQLRTSIRNTATHTERGAAGASPIPVDTPGGHPVIRFLDPGGTRYGIPTWPWGMAPSGLYTRSQLREIGFRPVSPGDPVGQLMWRSHRGDAGGIRTALLYPIIQTVQRATATPRQMAALDRAHAARKTCPDCRENVGYTIPAHLGICLDCASLYAKRVA